jgi:NTE family protein
MRGRVPVSPSSTACFRPSHITAVPFPNFGPQNIAQLENLALELAAICGEKTLALEIDNDKSAPSLHSIRNAQSFARSTEEFGNWSRLCVRLGKATADDLGIALEYLSNIFPFILVGGKLSTLANLNYPAADRIIQYNDGGRPGEIRHIARTIAARRIGLALSSGSAKGLAHIGVIEVLEEAGIEIDVVVGTSMGAYVGACWCAGNSAEKLRQLAGEMKTRRDVFSLLDPILPPRTGFIWGEKIRERIARSIENAQFEDLQREFHVVATRLDTLERHVFSTGDVATAVHASIAMPGVCAPVTIDGVSYTDGATCSPLPVRVLENMGIERIIAVNALPSTADLRSSSDAPVSPQRKSIGTRIGQFLNLHINYFANGNLLDTVMRGLQAGQMRMASTAAKRASVCIHTYPQGSRWFHFDQHEAYIAAGRAAALKEIDKIKSLTAINK